MKRCPKCNRTFPEEAQKFCTVDGGLLITDPTFDPNLTVRATSAELRAQHVERGVVERFGGVVLGRVERAFVVPDPE